MPPSHVAVGVDATPDGWVAVRYHDAEYHDVYRYTDPEPDDTRVDTTVEESAFEECWRAHADADVVLVDVPIGLPTDDPAREPERRARDVLGQRAPSVFNTPIRAILDVDDYDDANRIQQDPTGKGLMQQTFHITPRIREVDAVLAADHGPAADATQAVVREAHPELCFWALTDGDTPMEYSKTAQPAAAHWERVDALATVHDGNAFQDALAAAGRELRAWTDPKLGNDDLLDAFALAVTASPLTAPRQTLPETPSEDDMGLRMELVYAPPTPTANE
jgi:predicted RNase H-like nuclease